MLFPLQIRFTHFLFRFLDAYKDGANALDVVTRTRELKKRHRVPLVMPDDQSKRAYTRTEEANKIMWRGGGDRAGGDSAGGAR